MITGFTAPPVLVCSGSVATSSPGAGGAIDVTATGVGTGSVVVGAGVLDVLGAAAGLEGTSFEPVS
ncbi:hypothetical protein DMO24_01155 [Modestobacter versicolor]|uniref:Uncharacterized protein n=1 Tax=Modestobacter versicolor TaxID=429133 RepID=A0A323VEM7_9ACTN|nr:hypothetical protein DMO24_01155 [Modestobacter versicolor]